MVILKLKYYAALCFLICLSNSEAYAQSEIQKNIINEIISTEESYNKRLNDFKLHFLDFLLNDRTLRDNTYIQNIAKKIAQNFVTITKLSDEMLLSLKKDKTLTGIAKTFSALAPYLKVYGPYAANFTAINNEINNAQFNNNDKVKQLAQNWLKKLYPVDYLKKNIPKEIQDVLILPVQRVPRYKLLLEELQKAEANNAILNKALDDIKNISAYINNYK